MIINSIPSISVRRQLRELKMDICKLCKRNFEMEKELRFFDQRIALLINHKITVEEFRNDHTFGEQRLGMVSYSLLVEFSFGGTVCHFVMVPVPLV